MISTEQAREILVAEFPEWSPVSLSQLSGGITNRNLLIETSQGEKFVARLPGQDTELLGINREHEHAVSRVAWETGVAPEPVAYIAEHKMLVTRFVEGVPIQTDRPETLRAVGKLLRCFHSAPNIPGVFHLPSVISDYVAKAAHYSVSLPGELDKALSISTRIYAVLERRQSRSLPCHNDLLPANFLTNGHQLYLLDWEYSGMGDPYFDLGNCAVNFCLNQDTRHVLLEAYLGREPSSPEIAHLQLMRVLSDLRESMWGYLQVGISSLDEDYEAYGKKHLDRFLLNAKTKELETWLTTASGE